MTPSFLYIAYGVRGTQGVVGCFEGLGGVMQDLLDHIETGISGSLR